jgi:3-phenylpropionate/trans-cinnamate dioxygenase ferredoxin reductase component
MATHQTFIIAGAGLAGAKAAETLRDEGFDGKIVLIGEEPVRPYERPPLSKTYLRGESVFDSAAVHDAEFYGDRGIELLTSTVVVEVDPVAKRVILNPGGELEYDELLLTTGAVPRRLSISGSDLPGIHYLRTLANADDLRDAMGHATKVVIVGGGWIGSEVAASARELGKEVAMVEAGAVPLERVLGAEVGSMFAELHQAHEVQLHLNQGVEAFRGNARAEEVVQADGTAVAGDLFIVGVGVVPRMELGAKAGVDLDNGIVVDEYLATSVRGIWAAGDVANAYHPTFGRHIRLEHWSAALNQGPVAARNMLGQHVAYEKVPYFFSDQYDLGMEYNGYAATWDQVVYRGDPAKREVIVFWLNKGTIVAGMNVNVWEVADEIAALVAAKRSFDARRLELLTDPAVELNTFMG